ncbi:hypothetical protein [Rhodopirellula bahusiensis]|uniref:hypothetical protein n=1 Tax=Rhodopirellula bahusiensis TaxID=2014065 RepID=UPI0032636480
MHIDAKYKFELRDSFIVRVEPLLKLHTLLSERIGPTTIIAECADDVTRAFDSFAKLEQYENARSKRIVNLWLRSSGDSPKKSASVEFTDKWYFGGTRIEIQARDDVVTRLRSDLLDVIEGFRPWYHWINRFDISGLSIAGLAMVVFGSLGWIALNGSDKPSTAAPRVWSIGVLLGVGFSAFWFGTARLLSRFRSTVFPHGTFAIGQEIQRLETAEKWRWGLVIGFVFLVLGAIVSMLLAI